MLLIFLGESTLTIILFGKQGMLLILLGELTLNLMLQKETRDSPHPTLILDGVSPTRLTCRCEVHTLSPP